MSAIPTKEDLLKIAKQALFNIEMSRAVNDGRETQTRRAIKDSLDDHMEGCREPSIEKLFDGDFGCPTCGVYHADDYLKRLQKYNVGDILWVREPAKVIDYNLGLYIRYEYLSDSTQTMMRIPKRFIDFYKEGNQIIKTYQAIPKWIKLKQGVPNGCIKEMARTFLRVTNVRVERLQDISDKDIKAEGVSEDEAIMCNGWQPTYNDPDSGGHLAYDLAFESLWNSTAPKGYKWEDNPYVFVYVFEKVDYVP